MTGKPALSPQKKQASLFRRPSRTVPREEGSPVGEVRLLKKTLYQNDKPKGMASGAVWAPKKLTKLCEYNTRTRPCKEAVMQAELGGKQRGSGCLEKKERAMGPRELSVHLHPRPWPREGPLLRAPSRPCQGSQGQGRKTF